MLKDTNPSGQEYRDLSEVFRELQEIRYNPEKQIEYQQNIQKTEKAKKKLQMSSNSIEHRRGCKKNKTIKCNYRFNSFASCSYSYFSKKYIICRKLCKRNK